MSLLPDPAEMLAIADRIAGHAAATRARAHRLGSAVAATQWQGSAAHAFDVSAFVILAGLRHSAQRLDDAADALRHHAYEVEHVLAAVERLGQDALGVGNDVVSALRDGLITPQALLTDSVRLGHDLGAVAGDVGHAVGGALIGAGSLLGIG